MRRSLSVLRYVDSCSTNVSWFELGDICPAKPARQMLAKMMSFLESGQFYNRIRIPVRKRILSKKDPATRREGPFGALTNGSLGSSLGCGMRSRTSLVFLACGILEVATASPRISPESSIFTVEADAVSMAFGIGLCRELSN